MQFDYKTMPLLKQNAASITGPGLLYPGQSGTYTITNYDDFHSWSVSTDKGTVSRIGDQITLDISANESAGTANLTIDRNGISDTLQIAVGVAGIVKPSVLTPINGATDIIENPVYTMSQFATYPEGYDTLKSISVRVFDSSGSKIWELMRQPPGTVLEQAKGFLSEGSLHQVQVMQEGNILGDSEWSETVKFTTSDRYIEAGKLMPDGGIVAGQLDGYWWVVSPADRREQVQWSSVSTDTALINVSNPHDDYSDPETATDILISHSPAIVAATTARGGSISTPEAAYHLPTARIAYFVIYNNRNLIDENDKSGGDALLSAIASGNVPGNNATHIHTCSEAGAEKSFQMSMQNGGSVAAYKSNYQWVIGVRKIPV